ncbi:hypothetical protein CYY_007141 [Polysphondylium violaceum]|uniref:Uncharacterized protein n=1 Tax=Polysphondylium violaceum TaxID=133409 RepID=A0A8J4PQW0_9MYCE|nr:hypothetical protein CYY_007141 [Polysphondylium violaceum]
MEYNLGIGETIEVIFPQDSFHHIVGLHRVGTNESIETDTYFAPVITSYNCTRKNILIDDQTQKVSECIFKGSRLPTDKIISLVNGLNIYEIGGTSDCMKVNLIGAMVPRPFINIYILTTFKLFLEATGVKFIPSPFIVGGFLYEQVIHSDVILISFKGYYLDPKYFNVLYTNQATSYNLSNCIYVDQTSDKEYYYEELTCTLPSLGMSEFDGDLVDLVPILKEYFFENVTINPAHNFTKLNWQSTSSSLKPIYYIIFSIFAIIINLI